jgi:hypothetical protein
MITKLGVSWMSVTQASTVTLTPVPQASPVSLTLVKLYKFLRLPVSLKQETMKTKL